MREVHGGVSACGIAGLGGVVYIAVHNKETLKTERRRKDTDMTTANAAQTAPRVLAAGAEQRNDTVAARPSQAWERFQAYRATLADLRALTDRQLGDVG